jgi:hypothetical protein
MLVLCLDVIIGVMAIFSLPISGCHFDRLIIKQDLVWYSLWRHHDSGAQGLSVPKVVSDLLSSDDRPLFLAFRLL